MSIYYAIFFLIFRQIFQPTMLKNAIFCNMTVKAFKTSCVASAKNEQNGQFSLRN